MEIAPPPGSLRSIRTKAADRSPRQSAVSLPGCAGLAWSGLAWPGPAWPGPAWPGPAWPGPGGGGVDAVGDLDGEAQVGNVAWNEGPAPFAVLRGPVLLQVRVGVGES